MSEDITTDGEGRGARQFGEEIIEPGEPFTGETLDTIRALVAESPDDAAPEGDFAPAPVRRDAGAPLAQSQAVETRSQARGDGATDTWSAPTEASWDDEDIEARAARAGWRRLAIVEKGPGKFVRHFLTSPRWLALSMLAGVFFWRPWFIPALAFVIVFFLLLIGVLIGQDRMGRIMLHILRRYIWADPARGAALQKLLPKRWHPFLYKPLGEEDAWEGPVDPRFAERLARLR